MNKKTKRLGCSAIKDIVETNKIDIVDENTILEMSTFIARGQSYQASDGNHDDLMMNLVLFGYFANSQHFGNLTDISLKNMLFEQKAKEIDDDLPPFGIHDDGSSSIDEFYKDEKLKHIRDAWQVPYNHEYENL